MSKLQVPDEPSVAEPTDEPSNVKVSVPPPSGEPPAVTVTLSVCPPPLLGTSDSVVVVGICPTVSVSAPLEPVSYPASPEYTAVIECTPAARLAVEKVATPPLESVPVPSTVEP